MKTKLLYLILLAFLSPLSAQKNFDVAYEPIQKELTNWDPVRGHWLGKNLSNMTSGKVITDRAFPEDFTPYEMIKSLPSETYDNVQRIISNERESLSGNELDRWDNLSNYISNISCSYINGRSYGDPHLISFDKKRSSFQTVGEFVLTKSNHMEVQTRQKSSGTNFSLNTGIAMNVFGDRLCIYADDKPDQDRSALRLEGQPIHLQGRTYFLPHGGNVRLAGRNYIVTWPTGETVTVGMRSRFINVTVHVFNCNQYQYSGLLGNADGNLFNDFQAQNGSMRRPTGFFSGNTNNSNSFAEKEYLSYLSQSFADDWRVNDETTLFDYPIGYSTASYTDRSFPRVHHTIHDLNQNQFNNARTHCQNNGIPQSELEGCIYDQGFLNIPANPAPTQVDFTEDESLNRIRRPALNTNEHDFHDGKYPTGGNAVPVAPPNSNGTNPHHTTEDPQSKVIKSPTKETGNTWGNSSRPSRNENNSWNNSSNSRTPVIKSPSRNNNISKPNRTFKSNTPSRSTSPTKSNSPTRSSPSRSKGGKN